MSDLGTKERSNFKKIYLQDKASSINFKPFNHPISKLYNIGEILRLSDYIKLLYCIFVKEVLTKNHISIFKDIFEKVNETHNHATKTTRNSVANSSTTIN